MSLGSMISNALFEALAGGMLHTPAAKGNRLMVRDEGDVAQHFYGRGERRKGYPVHILRGYHGDSSRYTGAMLRAIRAERGCGRPPKVLAARRAKAARRAAFPQAAA
ncbi:hypothetical protein V5F32_00960 [Xanthobacter oligotrophicus]|uniref:Uncharacterized protein n=1 Tax=Xanthobacter oligotrophicus TaxID=2607286 RepID=A0ABW6ZS96_9HYPH